MPGDRHEFGVLPDSQSARFATYWEAERGDPQLRRLLAESEQGAGVELRCALLARSAVWRPSVRSAPSMSTLRIRQPSFCTFFRLVQAENSCGGACIASQMGSGVAGPPRLVFAPCGSPVIGGAISQREAEVGRPKPGVPPRHSAFWGLGGQRHPLSFSSPAMARDGAVDAWPPSICRDDARAEADTNRPRLRAVDLARRRHGATTCAWSLRCVR